MSFDLREHAILVTVSGSRAYGLATEASDVDLKGAAVPPARYLHGFLRRFEQADAPADVACFRDQLLPAEQSAADAHGLEGVVYDLAKFCRLAADCNPSILDVLFCRDDEVRWSTPLGERLRAARDAFLSQKARHTFVGYAAGQLRRIRRHRRWLLEPPKAKPTRAAFDLPETTLLPADQLAAARAAVRRRMDSWAIDYGELDRSSVLHIEQQVEETLTELVGATPDRWRAAARSIGLDDNLIAVMDRERRYRSALRAWQQYARWKQQRNPARAALEAAHGYDTKHGMHLIRLLRVGLEAMQTGRVRVWRGGVDADELLAVRAGAWSYERLVAEAEETEAALLDVVARGASPLPPAPDREALDSLVVELVEEALAARRAG